jgi:DNA/RNA-binding domain of Phe-tRNA-synthetase-like protein
MLIVTPAWRSAFPEAHAGVLVLREASNPGRHPDLERRKGQLEGELRSRFSGQDRAALANHSTLQAYDRYYKQFKKTYHVQLQLESIAWKGKSIPSMSALVEAMFMAEMKNLLLTAGHDLDRLSLPLVLDVSRGSERYTLMRGDEQTLKPGDMMIGDQAGVISSIIYGPDQRTQIIPETRNVVYTVYAPEGVDEQAVHRHLLDIREYVLLITPQAQVDLLEVHGGQGE